MRSTPYIHFYPSLYSSIVFDILPNNLIMFNARMVVRYITYLNVFQVYLFDFNDQ